MSDENERPDAQATRNFLASGGKEFNGLDLSPFSPQRMAVAAEMGMKWPHVEEDDQISLEFDAKLSKQQAEELNSGATGKKRFKAGQVLKQRITHYRQSYKDSLIALWLCAQTESRVDRAERKPKEAMTDAYAWAKSIAFFQGTPLSGEALVIWLSICAEIVESKSTPVSPTKGGPPEQEDSGEL